jgi:hypothetical protein
MSQPSDAQRCGADSSLTGTDECINVATRHLVWNLKNSGDTREKHLCDEYADELHARGCVVQDRVVALCDVRCPFINRTL